MEDPDGVILARDARALWPLVHARQPLPDLAQRGTLDTHAAGLTGLGGTLPFLRLTLKCHCSTNINAITTIVLARLVMSLFRPFLCYLITVVTEQSGIAYVFPMPSILLASSGVAIARRNW